MSYDFIFLDQILYGWTHMTTGEQKMTRTGGDFVLWKIGWDCSGDAASPFLRKE